MTRRQTSLRPEEGGKFHAPVKPLQPLTGHGAGDVSDVAQALDERMSWKNTTRRITGTLGVPESTTEGRLIRLTVEAIDNTHPRTGLTLALYDRATDSHTPLYRKSWGSSLDVTRREGVRIMATWLVQAGAGGPTVDVHKQDLPVLVDSIRHIGTIDRAEVDAKTRASNARYRRRFDGRAGVDDQPPASADLTPPAPRHVIQIPNYPISLILDEGRIDGERILIEAVSARTLLQSYYDKESPAVRTRHGLFQKHTGVLILVTRIEAPGGVLRLIHATRVPETAVDAYRVRYSIGPRHDRWERSPGDPGAAFDTLVASRAGEAPPVSCRCLFETGADGLPVRVGLRCEPCRRQLAVG